MHTHRSFFGIASRAAAFSFLMAGAVSMTQAQQSSSTESTLPRKAPLFLASESASPRLISAYDASYFSSSSSSSSSSDAAEASSSDPGFNLNSPAPDSSQPPPRRRYGRPNYSDSHSNPDGSSKYAFVAGVGLTLPVGDTHYYETPSYGVQVGVGRNFSKSVGIIAQFDWDHFGLQGATLANQQYLYNYGCTVSLQRQGLCSLVTTLDGNNHVWSFTLNPTFTLATEGSLGAYAVVGGGFYHKVTNFTLPSAACADIYCYYQYTVNKNIDHYTSNAGGVNGGIGLTYKFSKFSNERFYAEVRYVVVLNAQRYGVKASSSIATLNAYNGFDLYPANSNRTTYVPIKVGIRF